MKRNREAMVHRLKRDVRRLRTLIGVAVVMAGCLSACAQATNAPAHLNYDSFRMVSDRNIFNPNRVAGFHLIRTGFSAGFIGGLPPCAQAGRARLSIITRRE